MFEVESKFGASIDIKKEIISIKKTNKSQCRDRAKTGILESNGDKKEILESILDKFHIKFFIHIKDSSEEQKILRDSR